MTEVATVNIRCGKLQGRKVYRQTQNKNTKKLRAQVYPHVTKTKTEHLKTKPEELNYDKVILIFANFLETIR